MKTITTKKKTYTLQHKSEVKFYPPTPDKITPEDKFVLSEDGFIVPILGYSKLNDHQFTLRTPLGTYKHPTGTIHTTEFDAGFGTGEGKHLTDKQKRFGMILALTGDRVKSIMETYGAKDRLSAQKKASKLLTKTKVREFVDREVTKILTDMGVDKTWVLKRLVDEAKQQGEKGVNPMPAIKELLKIMEITTTVKKTQKISIPLPPHVLKSLSGMNEGEVASLAEFEVTDGDNSSAED